MDAQIKELISKITDAIMSDTEEGVHRENRVWGYELDKIHESAKSLDKSGILELLRLVDLLKESLSNTYVSICKILSDRNTLQKYEEQVRLTEVEVASSFRKALVSAMANAVSEISRQSVIGDVKKIDDEFDNTLAGVLDGFGKLRFEVYLKSSMPVGRMTRFNPFVNVCESLAECLIGLEKSEDGVYVCFISTPGTLDGWFGFFFKSNGNIFSLNDRIDEAYVGQHRNMRNGRYAEEKAFSIFPYDLCEFSSERDYRGYSKEMKFGEQKEILFAGGDFGALMRSVLVIVLTAQKYNGKKLSGDIVFVDSLLSNNINQIDLSGSQSHDLIKIEDSAVITVNAKLQKPTFDIATMLSGGYDSQYNDCDNGKGYFHGVNQEMVDAYGEGFSIDYEKILSSNSTRRLLGDTSCQQEFVGIKTRYDLRAYYEARKQLADYIWEKMNAEYAEFGGLESLEKWYFDKVTSRKELIYKYCFDAYKHTSGEEGRFDVGNIVTQENVGGFARQYTPIHITVSKKSWISTLINEKCDGVSKCPITGKNANVFFHFSFGSSKDVEEIIGEKLPKFCSGWYSETPYNGNCILDVVDPVGELQVPFADSFRFRFGIGLSKLAFKRTAKDDK